MVSKLQRSDYSRLWLLEDGAGPATQPQYESLWRAGPVAWPFGDSTNIYVPDPDRYGQFTVAGKIIGDRGNPTITLTGRYQAEVASVLLRLAKKGCDCDLQIHMGECKSPQDFNGGWDKVLALDAARATRYGTTDLGALQPSQRSAVDEEVPISAEDMYEILRIVFHEQAAAQVTQEVVDIAVCDEAQCGACGTPSDGCQHVFAVVKNSGGSPGLFGEVIATANGGTSWIIRPITTLLASENPSAVVCAGKYLVVASADSSSLHYAPIADILTGTETWTEVNTGFVAGKGPRCAWAADPQHIWFGGTQGYIYVTADPTAGVTVQDAGLLTIQNLNAIHGSDNMHVVAVGDGNIVLTTDNGGSTWSAVAGPAAGVSLSAVFCRSDTEWMVGTATGRLYYTRDGGTSWTEKSFPGSGAGNVRDIVFVTRQVGYLAHDTATPRGRILRTIDGGYSWYVAPENNTSIPTNQRITALATCDDPNIVWGGGLSLGGTDGIIVKGS